LTVAVVEGERNDAAEARVLLGGLTACRVVADRAYAAGHIREAIARAGAEAIIPLRRHRRAAIPYDRAAYRWRNAARRFWGRLKQCRRIAARHDEFASHVLGFVHLACLRLRRDLLAGSA
jgi:transposase